MKKAVLLLLCLVLLFALAVCKGAAGASGNQSRGPAFSGVPNSAGSAPTGSVQKEPGIAAKAQPDSATDEAQEEETEAMRSIKMTINGTDFWVVLEHNETAREFVKRLPLTLEMEALHGNEKFKNLPQSLPTSPATPAQIQTGDLMLFGSDCLVLFYQSFSSSYRYTKIGSVQAAEALAEAVGAGSVSIAFATE